MRNFPAKKGTYTKKGNFENFDKLYQKISEKQWKVFTARFSTIFKLTFRQHFQPLFSHECVWTLCSIMHTRTPISCYSPLNTSHIQRFVQMWELSGPLFNHSVSIATLHSIDYQAWWYEDFFALLQRDLLPEFGIDCPYGVPYNPAEQHAISICKKTLKKTQAYLKFPISILL